MPSFKASIEHSCDAIVLMNPEGEALYASPSSAKVFGYLTEEMIGQNYFEFLHPKYRDHSLAQPPSTSISSVNLLPRSGPRHASVHSEESLQAEEHHAHITQGSRQAT
jgi:PAS domain-containing protein